MDSIRKRSGEVVAFDQKKITWAIYKAAEACGGSDYNLAEELSNKVIEDLDKKFKDRVPNVEQVQDLVEYVLIEEGHAQTAKAYILYREKRSSARYSNALTGATIDMFSKYLNDEDWQIQENANIQKSVCGLNNYVRENFTKRFWLNKIYPVEVREAHESGLIHIHDLGSLSSYCQGHDLFAVISEGFGGVPGKVNSKPPKHLSSLLGQVVNSTFTTQGESAGAQAWANFDTYCAPFVRYDNLTCEEVKQQIQEFIFNLNVPTRTANQPPFSNITFDLICPKTLKDKNVVIGGEVKKETYADFQKEINMIDQAFCEVMLEGDADGRVFTFPVPTVNITKTFDWTANSVKWFMRLTAKYGAPYFANYVNSDMSEDDAISLCCRLRVNTSELKHRGGGLFGSNPSTGSIGVVTLNLPRIAYQEKKQGVEQLFIKIKSAMDTAYKSLEIKRKVVEDYTRNGLYPYSANYLRGAFERTGEYWFNHFSTIGLVGMNEALLNYIGEDITTESGQKLALEILEFMRDTLKEYQEESGHVYNLEATPAEGTSYRLAKLDKSRYPDIICAGVDVPYYTNSSQLPVGYTDDILDTLEKQDALQSCYTGGTVLHLYLGEAIEDSNVCAELIKRVFSKYKLPYLSITPTFSVCPDHGYIPREEPTCSICGGETEVWSRVTGYLRPVKDYNAGKKEEHKHRLKYTLRSLT